jgi:hypothetical protein
VSTSESRDLQDFAFLLTPSDDLAYPICAGHFTFFGATGRMGMTKGFVLRDD